MSQLSDIILPVGLVLLGAFAVTKLFSGQQPTCTGDVSRTCLGPLCFASCKETGGSSGFGGATQGADIYGTPYQSYPWGSLNLGLPATGGNAQGTCGPLDWMTDWDRCGFSW